MFIDMIFCPHFRALSGDVHPAHPNPQSQLWRAVRHLSPCAQRVGSSVKQSTLLNLGSHFDLPQNQWPALAARIDQLVRGQGSLVESTLSDAGQALAHAASCRPDT